MKDLLEVGVDGMGWKEFMDGSSMDVWARREGYNVL